MTNNNLIEEYLSKAHWRVKENSNTSFSFSGVKYYIDSHVLADYALFKLPESIRKAHDDGDFHIHNLESGNLIPYCAGCSLLDLLVRGLYTPSIVSKPAKHFSSVSDHVMNYLYMRQMETAGAVAFNDVDTLLAPYIRSDGLSREAVKQNIQRLVFNLNFTLRSSSQTPFTNFSLNFGVPSYMTNEPVIIGGKSTNTRYSDYIDEIELFDELFMEILMDRDANGRPFPFPIPTLNLTKRFNMESSLANKLYEECLELGSFYFMNYVGSGISEDSVRAMCCRLNLDLSELSDAHGLWNNGDSTGSLGVVTINLPRIGYLAKTESDLYDRLDRLMDLARDELLLKEHIIRESLSNDLLPFSKFYNLNLDHFFRTIGIVGLNEMCMNFLGSSIVENTNFAYAVLSHMRERIRMYQTETKKLFNLEMTPAEGCSYRLAKDDLSKFPNIKTLGTVESPYYSSLIIPPQLDTDFLERLRIEEKILPLFNGGTVFRTFIGENITDRDVVADIIKIVASSKIPYFDITSTFSVCPNEGKYTRGSVEKCPSCGGENEVYSRVVGYYRPIKKWNNGKQQEFKDRKYLNKLE